MSRCSLGFSLAAKAFSEEFELGQRSGDGLGLVPLHSLWVDESEDRLSLLIDFHTIWKMWSDLEGQVPPLASWNPKAELQVTVDDHRSGIVSFLHLELVPLRK